MAMPATPAEMQNYIVERLLGDTGDPGPVAEAAQALAERILPRLVEGIGNSFCVPLAVEIRSVELTRFADARPSDAAGHAIGVAAFEASPDALVLSIDNLGIAVLVSAFFGGDPEQPLAAIERELSPTEVEVATMMFEEIGKAVDGAGSRAGGLSLPIPAALIGMDLRKLVLRDGPAVRIAFSVSVAAGQGTVSVFLPQRMLMKPRAAAGGEGASGWRARFNEEVLRSSVSLHATMPLGSLTLGQIADLRPGQVIELEAGAQADARLLAKDKTLFVCEFGKLGQNYTVRIRQSFDAGQDLIEGLMAG